MANLSRNLRWQSVYGSKFISGIVVKKKKPLFFSGNQLFGNYGIGSSRYLWE